jgi:hypothetical protein
LPKQLPGLAFGVRTKVTALAPSAVFGEGLVDAEKGFVLSPQSLDGEASHAPGTALEPGARRSG